MTATISPAGFTPREIALIQVIATGGHLDDAATRSGHTRPSVKYQLLLAQQRHQQLGTQAALVAHACQQGLLDDVDFGPWRPVTLPQRQRQVLQLLGTGLSNKQIGTRLGIRLDTVRSHLKAIFRSIGAHTRAHAVALDWRWQYSQDGAR